jgi:hypothetical protein
LHCQHGVRLAFRLSRSPSLSYPHMQSVYPWQSSSFRFYRFQRASSHFAKFVCLRLVGWRAQDELGLKFVPMADTAQRKKCTTALLKHGKLAGCHKEP